MGIKNDKECFVRLWRLLERTRRYLWTQHKRFCIREVMKLWFEGEATDDFIWQVCRLSGQEGWNELLPPARYPRKHRELIRAVVAVMTGISYYQVDLHELDNAYSKAFPRSTPLNVNKKKRNAEAGPSGQTARRGKRKGKRRLGRGTRGKKGRLTRGGRCSISP